MTGLKRLLRISVLFLGDVLWGVLTYGVLAWLKFGGPVPEYNRGECFLWPPHPSSQRF